MNAASKGHRLVMLLGLAVRWQVRVLQRRAAAVVANEGSASDSA